ncbi:23771_t:CDS:2 [Gigaspora margarita]|uniref:23771_t:CDS:1 n=1 Tax=Gigaspora margarita TaxID=4874 RepID=A0ABM8W083_GIGMA|nr:23771_t:CDS:2 [Gigaspora margarita]
MHKSHGYNVTTARIDKMINEQDNIGTTQYLIKWEDFGSEDNTWENEGNVKYWNKESKSRNKVKIPNKRKQNITNSPVDDSNLSNGAINSNVPTRTRDTSGSQFSDRVDAINNVCSEDCWENLATISDVFLDYSTSQLLMLLIWNNGTKSYHTAQEVHRKCPRQSLSKLNLGIERNTPERYTYNPIGPVAHEMPVKTSRNIM